MAAHQAPPSLGFSRQEHWSGLPFSPPMHESEKSSRSVVPDPQRPHGLQPSRLLRPWDFPGKSTGVGCHCLLHSIPDTFPYLLNKHTHLMSPILSVFQPLLCILPLYLPPSLPSCLCTSHPHYPPASEAGDSAPGREKVSYIFNVSF